MRLWMRGGESQFPAQALRSAPVRAAALDVSEAPPPRGPASGGAGLAPAPDRLLVGDGIVGGMVQAHKGRTERRRVISVLVATRNRGPELETQLRSFGAIEAPDGGWALLVIDNGPAGGTAPLQ